MNKEEKKNQLSKFFLYLMVANYAGEGLAETLPGVTWPMIAEELKFNIGFISILTMVSYIGAGISSLYITKIRKKLGTNYTLIITNMIFIVGLFLFGFSQSIVVIALGMFIVGLAIGADEVNIDSYVIKAYDASWDSIVHAFNFVGPILITLFFGTFLRYISSYKNIYVYTFVIFIALNIILYLGKKHWEKRKFTLDNELVERHSVSEEEKNIKMPFLKLLKQKNILKAFACFFLANGISRVLTVCINSIVVSQKGFSISMAAYATATYFATMFLGRMFFGFLVKKVSIKVLIRASSFLSIIAFILFYFDIQNNLLTFILVGLIGFSTAPFIPLVSSDMKNIFDVSLLSTILGYGVMIGLFAVSTVSALISVAIGLFSMKATQIILIILTILLILIHGNLHSEQNSV